MTFGKIQTALKLITANELGLTLPHEHIFTDLRGPRVPGYAQAQPQQVVSVMKPYLDEIQQLGVNAIVECSTIGVGRNPEILKTLAENTSLYIIVPTGVYREAYVPPDLWDKSVEELAGMWVKDIKEGIDGSSIKAEAKNLKAAVLTSQQTGAVIASHTIGGNLADKEMDLLEIVGLDLNRFIWTHAQSEENKSFHISAAKRGAYISIDAIGSGWVPDEAMLEYTLALIEAGHTDKILLSHDAGWYDPSQPTGKPEGDGIRGYTALFKRFIPEMIKRGVPEETINHIIIQNPAQAFAFNGI